MNKRSIQSTKKTNGLCNKIDYIIATDTISDSIFNRLLRNTISNFVVSRMISQVSENSNKRVFIF